MHIYDDIAAFFAVGMLAFFIIGGLLCYGYDLVVKLFRKGSKLFRKGSK